jgi:Domain of unknown function (DUF927)
MAMPRRTAIKVKTRLAAITTRHRPDLSMDPKSGLTADVVKGSGKNIRTETVWIAAAFEILGRVRDPKSEGWARLLRWRDDDGRFHEHPVSDEDLHTDPSLLCARLAGLGLRITTGPARSHLIRYLNSATVAPRITIYPRPGWHDVNERAERMALADALLH